MSETSFRAMLENMDLHEIERLKLAKQALTWLEGRRRALEDEIAAVDGQIAGVKEGRLDPGSVLPKTETEPVKKGEKRPRRTVEGTVASRIVEVLRAKGSAMSIEEITKAVLEAGCTTTSKSFRRVVTAVVGTVPEVERAGRALYRLKSPA